MRILLASNSPRRRELIGQLRLPVQTVSLQVDEHVSPTLPPYEVAEYLACRKSAAYATPLLPGEILVTADTVVIVDNRVLGKPASRTEAVEMLRLLSGREHTVDTGVCLRTCQHQSSFTERTTVHFLPLSETIIAHYVDTYQPFDKAGAYGIQEWIGMVGIKSIEGCFYNVIGMPMARFYGELVTLLEKEGFSLPY